MSPSSQKIFRSPLKQKAFRRILVINLFAPVALVLISGFISTLLVFRLLSSSHWVDHSDQVMAQSNRILKLILDAETGQRGYLLTGKKQFLEPYLKATSVIGIALADLKKLVANDPIQEQRLNRIQSGFQKWLDYSHAMLEMKRKNQNFIGNMPTGPTKAIMDDIREQFDLSNATEVISRDKWVQTTAAATRITVSVIFFACLVTVFIILFFGRRQLLKLSDEYNRVLSAAEEERATLAAIVVNSDDAIISKDLNGIIKSWNIGAQRLFGYTPEEAIGRPITMLIPPELKNEEYEILKRLKAGERVDHFETLRLTKDQRKIMVSVTASPITNDQGIITGASKIARDITHLKKLEADLRSAIQEREEFLSIASHELRTPLTALHLQLQLLERLENKEVQGSRVISLSSGALRATQQLAGLLDALLDVTRIRAGKLSLDKQVVNLKVVVMDCVLAMSEHAKQQGSLVTIEGDASVIGKWDPSRTNQIVSNLLSNAIKYGEGKPIEVSVKVDHKTERAILCVRDHGMGISSKMHSTIFERFERAASATQITGLGLGLYIVRQIVEAHDGTIRVESELGKGSLFIVELPIRETHETRHAA
jgi:PAS domain S-box-containing protein